MSLNIKMEKKIRVKNQLKNKLVKEGLTKNEKQLLNRLIKEAPIDYDGPERMEPGIEKKITNTDLHHDTDYTPYEGINVKCWPDTVISRGKVIIENGKLLGKKGFGKFLKSDISSYVY